MSALTRRAFLGRASLAGGALAATGAFALPIAAALAGTGASVPPRAAVTSGLRARPVIAFFDGQLWLDTSGTSVPYRPPHGARGAAALAMMTDEELRRAHLWL